MRKLYLEIELDGVITAKRVQVPLNIDYGSPEMFQYIRKHFSGLGYTVGSRIRCC